MKYKFKIAPESLKNESGLIQMIKMGNFIRQKWVKKKAPGKRETMQRTTCIKKGFWPPSEAQKMKLTFHHPVWIVLLVDECPKCLYFIMI